MSEDLMICMPASPTSPRFARNLMERHLIKWGYARITDDTLLVTAELVTNAIRATPGKVIKLRCVWGASAITVEVWDSSPEPPAPAPVVELSLDDLEVSESSFDGYGGRGLHIVEALAIAWGHRFDPIDPATGHSPGKWVWARLHV
jgi:anti-sigma regulatory factor (Ser/Thr protein kinase)